MIRRRVVRGRALPARLAPFHADERGQSLAIVLTLVTVLFLMGSALAVHASVALRTTVHNETQADDLHAADAGAELGMWWQRNGNPGTPPAITVNGLTVATTVGIAGAVACPTPTPIRLTGFEAGAVDPAGAGLFSAVTGTGMTADAAVAKSGSYSLKDTDPAASANNASISVGPTGVVVMRLYIRLASLPAADVNELFISEATAGSALRFGYQASSQRFTLRFAAAAVTVATAAVTAGTWYRVDVRFTANANPRTADWQIDGAAQTAVSAVAVASTVATLRLGSTVAADTFTANYDDVLLSATTGDYPIGAGTILPLPPDGMGTNINAASFRHDDASTISATTWQRLDESPMTSLADYVRQQVIGAGDYVETTFGDTAATCLTGVSGVVARHAAGTAANNGRTTVVDGATERILFSGDMSDVPLTYSSAIVTPVAGSWTTATVNALKGRIGYSSDVTPNPYWDALLLEVATGSSVAGTVTVTSTAGNSTVTATYTDVGAASPSLLTWSTTR